MSSGCVYTHPLCHYGTLIVFFHKALGYYIHIGVGSDVVCSTLIGNARASIRGMDNSDDSTLFFVSSIEPTSEREENQACLDYPEREGGRAIAQPTTAH